MVLGEVEETIYAVDEDDEDEEVKVSCPDRLGLQGPLLMVEIRTSARSPRCCLCEVGISSPHRLYLATDNDHRRQRCFDLTTSCTMI
jgi:hypothetical protein